MADTPPLKYRVGLMATAEARIERARRAGRAPRDNPETRVAWIEHHAGRLTQDQARRLADVAARLLAGVDTS